MFSRRNAIMFLATGFFVGRCPVAPGTLGSLIGIPVAFILAGVPWQAALPAIVLLTLAAVWVAGRAERLLKAKDPGCIVIDEIAGMAVTLFAIPLTLGTTLAGFILFRLLDITKPPPIRQMERRLSGGWGVVMDDIVAGVMGNIILQLGLYLIGLA